ncbi:MAG: DUF1467 family protein [Alphaproteobacteria bacterium]
MDFVSGLVVYILLWWWVFLMSLPFGARPPEEPGRGHATSAPARPMLWRKALVTTLVAAVLFVIVYLIIDSGVISFRPNPQ